MLCTWRLGWLKSLHKCSLRCTDSKSFTLSQLGVVPTFVKIPGLYKVTLGNVYNRWFVNNINNQPKKYTLLRHTYKDSRNLAMSTSVEIPFDLPTVTQRSMTSASIKVIRFLFCNLFDGLFVVGWLPPSSSLRGRFLDFSFSLRRVVAITSCRLKCYSVNDCWGSTLFLQQKYSSYEPEVFRKSPSFWRMWSFKPFGYTTICEKSNSIGRWNVLA